MSDVLNPWTGQIVLTMSLDPFADRRICDGAKATLALIRALAGHARRIVTLTCSLARQRARCTNTIRNHYRALEEAGYIAVDTDPTTGRTTIYVLGIVEPPSRQARLEIKRADEEREWPRLPKPRNWRRGGAQLVADIKTISLPLCLSKEDPKGESTRGTLSAGLQAALDDLGRTIQRGRSP